MNCNDRRLIIWAGSAIASLVLILIGTLLVLDKAVPTEPWMIVSSIVAGLFSVFQHRSTNQANSGSTVVVEEEK